MSINPVSSLHSRTSSITQSSPLQTTTLVPTSGLQGQTITILSSDPDLVSSLSSGGTNTTTQMMISTPSMMGLGGPTLATKSSVGGHPQLVTVTSVALANQNSWSSVSNIEALQRQQQAQLNQLSLSNGMGFLPGVVIFVGDYA